MGNNITGGSNRGGGWGAVDGLNIGVQKWSSETIGVQRARLGPL